MIAVLAMMGCGGVPAPIEERSFTVDCLGMHPSFVGGFTAQSSLWSLDPQTGTRLERCVVFGHEQLTGEPTPVVDSEALGANLFDPAALPWVYFSVAAAGRLWIAQSGEANFDQGFSQEKASGSYVLEAVGKDLATRELTGETAQIAGRFDWCASTRDDCPYPAGAGLERGFAMSTPGAQATGKLAACRALLDEELGAFRLDLAVGVWNDRNVGTLWVNECSQGGVILPLPNVLRFTAGGVHGDGTWSDLPVVRFAVVDGDPYLNPGYAWAEVRAADLSFVHPATFSPQANETLACIAYGKTSQLRIDGGTCSVAIDQVAERIVIDCTNTLHDNLDGLGAWETGPTHLEVDCPFLPWPG